MMCDRVLYYTNSNGAITSNKHPIPQDESQICMMEWMYLSEVWTKWRKFAKTFQYSYGGY